MVMYREVCPEGVQNKCPGGGGGGYGVEALCPGGDTLILVISRGVQLYYGIAQCSFSHTPGSETRCGTPGSMPKGLPRFS